MSDNEYDIYVKPKCRIIPQVDVRMAHGDVTIYNKYGEVRRIVKKESFTFYPWKKMTREKRD